MQLCHGLRRRLSTDAPARLCTGRCARAPIQAHFSPCSACCAEAPKSLIKKRNVEMKLKFKITQLAALTTLAFAGNAFATDVEVLHYWNSGGEAKSVGQLQQIVKESGFGWKDFAVAGGAGENAATALKTRVIS